MPEEDDLSYLCGRKYFLLAKLREEGLSEGEMADLREIESRIFHAQLQRPSGDSGYQQGWFDLLESRVKAAIKRFM